MIVKKNRIFSSEKMRISGNCIYDYAHSFSGEKIFNPMRYTFFFSFFSRMLGKGRRKNNLPGIMDLDNSPLPPFFFLSPPSTKSSYNISLIRRLDYNLITRLLDSPSPPPQICEG